MGIAERIKYNSGKIKREDILEEFSFDKLEIENDISSAITNAARTIKNLNYRLENISQEDKENLYEATMRKIEVLEKVARELFNKKEEEVKIVKVKFGDNEEGEEENE